MTLELIHAELVRIREALEARPYASGVPSHKAIATQGKSDDVPMPTEVIANAGEVQVHFGKNKGVSLSSLGDRSVSWYAQEPEPRIGNNGKPFPPRAEDVLLRNAARTMIHQKRGTLAGAAVNQPIASVTASIDDENVPF
jgi:hypothetical protein